MNFFDTSSLHCTVPCDAAFLGGTFRRLLCYSFRIRQTPQWVDHAVPALVVMHPSGHGRMGHRFRGLVEADVFRSACQTRTLIPPRWVPWVSHSSCELWAW